MIIPWTDGQIKHHSQKWGMKVRDVENLFEEPANFIVAKDAKLSEKISAKRRLINFVSELQQHMQCLVKTESAHLCMNIYNPEQAFEVIHRHDRLYRAERCMRKEPGARYFDMPFMKEDTMLLEIDANELILDNEENNGIFWWDFEHLMETHNLYYKRVNKHGVHYSGMTYLIALSATPFKRADNVPLLAKEA